MALAWFFNQPPERKVTKMLKACKNAWRTCSNYATKVVNFFKWLYHTPVTTFFCRAVIWILKSYKKLWIKITFNRQGKFVYKRAFMSIVGTFVFIMLIPNFLMIFLNTGLYALTVKTETVYLYLTEEIYPNQGIWSLKGCKSVACNRNSSIYYRIKPSYFNHIWSLLTSFSLFLPDVLGSSVPPGVSKCEIKSYGFRFKTLMNWDIYPDVLRISCEDKELHPAQGVGPVGEYPASNTPAPAKVPVPANVSAPPSGPAPGTVSSPTGISAPPSAPEPSNIQNLNETPAPAPAPVPEIVLTEPSVPPASPSDPVVIPAPIIEPRPASPPVSGPEPAPVSTPAPESSAAPVSNGSSAG